MSTCRPVSDCWSLQVSGAQDLDGVIAAHDTYLKQMLQGALLGMHPHHNLHDLRERSPLCLIAWRQTSLRCSGSMTSIVDPYSLLAIKLRWLTHTLCSSSSLCVATGNAATDPSAAESDSAGGSVGAPGTSRKPPCNSSGF